MQKMENLLLNSNWFHKDDKMDYFKRLNLFLRILGFSKLYQLRVLEEPKQREDGVWFYTTKPIGYTITWIGITIKTVVYDNG